MKNNSHERRPSFISGIFAPLALRVRINLLLVTASLLVSCASAVRPGSPLHDAVFEGNLDAVNHHLDAGINIDSKNKVGNTALHYAAYKADHKIARLLIFRGADVNAKGNDGYTPMDWVFELRPPNAWLRANKGESDRTKLIDLFRKHGAKTGEELKAEGK